MTASGQAVQRREAQASAAVPEAGQGDQRQGALCTRIGRALLEAEGKRQRPLCRHRGGDSPDEFTESVSEAELLARPEGFDHLHTVGENFATLRRYTPALAGGAGTARRAGRARRAGSRADPA